MIYAQYGQSPNIFMSCYVPNAAAMLSSWEKIELSGWFAPVSLKRQTNCVNKML